MGAHIVGESDRLGGLYLLWSGAAGQNCAVALKNVAVGTSSPMQLALATEDGEQVTDNGSFGYYAGPVYLAAAGTCVSATASLDHGGDTGTGTIPMGHCG